MVMPEIIKRRSIRKFEEMPVEEEKVDTIIEAALRSPSSMGRDPWEFIVINDKTLLEKLSKVKQHGSAFLKGAAIGIVVCADNTKSDVWIEDTSIASTHIYLAAEALGLGACWIQLRKRNYSEEITSEEYVASILNLPDEMAVLSIIAIGYPAEKLAPHKKESLKYERVHFNGFGKR
ncbi:MAG: nitroreductase family protein [Deltaproteobacteria bacterium]|nr:nitroreductase family protein [Deltaproteobacteria bacterium]